MNFLEFLKSINKDRLFDSSNHKIETSNILIDQSNQNISEESYRNFQKFVDDNNFVQRLKKVQRGELSNISENKPATHFQYREEGSSLYTANINNLKNISNKLKDKKTIIFFGIGGSYLAPNLLNQVFGSLDKEIIFITGSDPDEYKYLEEKSLEGSAFILATKSFSTTETLTSYESVTNRNFLSDTFVVTSNVDEAKQYGISNENIIPMDGSMGGRFSIWGPINLLFYIVHGEDKYKEFLKGAEKSDQLSLNEDINQNPSLTLSVQDVIMNNICDIETTLVINYDWKLRNFYQYVQQVEMESTGKSVDQNGKDLDYETGMIVWGGFGPRSQHSFFQQVYQGTRNYNLYFVVTKSDQLNYKQFLGQSKSLKEGNDGESNTNKRVSRRSFTTIELNSLTPEAVGELMAMWENKVIFNSFFWNINPFDQWGVELGKTNTKSELDK